MLKKQRFIIVVLLGLVVSGFFWGGSRYPDLNEKAMMAGEQSVADTLSVWPIFTVLDSDSLAMKIAKTTANWSNDNKKGMVYGVFLGGIFMTLISYLSLSGIHGSFRQTLMGFFLGAPLGVCVNCAAPVFKGIASSRRLETAFATMLSSPTMNIVVLTMVFTVFPLYMGLVKVAFSLLAIFVVVPALSRLLANEDLPSDPPQAEVEALAGLAGAQCHIPGNEAWGRALKESFIDLFQSLRFLTIRTVPLMLLAGFLGAALSHSVNLDQLLGVSGVWAIFVASLVGVFLPLPVAFDVILTSALYTQGLSIGVTLSLLCTLGIYSIYALFITWTTASRQWALALYTIFVVMGVGVGMVGEYLHTAFYVEPNIQAYRTLTVGDYRQSQVAIDRQNAPEFEVRPALMAPDFEPFGTQGEAVLYAPFRESISRSKGGFVKHEGYSLGLVRGFRYGIRDYPDPFWIGRGTAAGDFDGDGWEDIVLGSNRGPRLYRNRGGSFQEVAISNDFMRSLLVYAVAFVDMDNDGWQDLFLTTFMKGNFFVRNHQGVFQWQRPIKVDNGGGVLTISPGFGDFDGDGLLDIVNGNMALGVVTGSWQLTKGRGNYLTYNRGFRFETEGLPGYSGETMSSLVSDLNGDGFLDIYFGNDFVIPDNILLGTKKDVFVAHGREPNGIQTPVFSMSADSGDINNDLKLDFLVTGTLGKRSFVGKSPIDGVVPEEYSKHTWMLDACYTIKNPVVKENCIINRRTNHMVNLTDARNVEASTCEQLPTEVERQDCLLASMWLLITGERKVEDCRGEFRHDPLLKDVCEVVALKGEAMKPGDFPKALPQKDDSFLYLGRKDGSFVDINREKQGYPHRYRHPGGWTWNTKLADLDHDGYLDIFNAEGTVRQNDYGFNVLMKSIQGGFFLQKQFSAGLTDNFNLFSFVYSDFDNDGDLDIIGNSSVGPVQVYENQFTEGRGSISIELRDDQEGNHFGIGARVTIYFMDGSAQMREIKASGGYLSFDHPKAFFGLGGHKEANKILVRWPDGDQQTIEADFLPGRYIVKRI